MSTLKEILRALVDHLPDDCDWRLFHYRLYVAKRLEEGLKDVEAGRTHSHEEVQQLIKDWSREAEENPKKRRVTVDSRERLVDFLFQVQDELIDRDGKRKLNASTVEYLEALKAWLETCEGQYDAHDSPINPNEPSWQLFADALRAALRAD